jgi:hypothetical protein
MTGCHECPARVEDFVSEQPFAPGHPERRREAPKSKGAQDSLCHASGEVEECHAGGALGLRLRFATLRPNGDGTPIGKEVYQS